MTDRISQNPGLSADQWREKLAEIGRNLKNPTSLCIIGSAPGMFGGQPSRVSIDLDTWRAASDFAYSDLKQACEKAGLMFDPKGEIEPDRPYIQIVDAGIVQVGKFAEKSELLKEGALVVQRPPWENIVASKLLRASEKDVEDVAFIVASHGVTRRDVERVLRGFPKEQRERASENLVFLDVLAPAAIPPLPTPACPGPSLSRER